jgi:hypothetical protein
MGRKKQNVNGKPEGRASDINFLTCFWKKEVNGCGRAYSHNRI